MKSICLENLRKMKYERMKPPPPKPITLDPSWYTDNIYSNQSIDLDEDYVPDCLKYNNSNLSNNRKKMNNAVLNNGYDSENQRRHHGHDVQYNDLNSNNTKLRDISEYDESYDEDEFTLQRSKSCKEFKYPKSRSCCFGGTTAVGGNYDSKSEAPSKPSVPKSYSFSVNCHMKTKPFDVIDYEPPPSHLRKDGRTLRKSATTSAVVDANNSSYERHHHHHNRSNSTTLCCARDHCVNTKCFLDEIPHYDGSSVRSRSQIRERDRRPYSSGSINGNKRNIITEWEDRGRSSSSAHTLKYAPESPCKEPYCYKRHRLLRCRSCDYSTGISDDHDWIMSESADRRHPRRYYEEDDHSSPHRRRHGHSHHHHHRQRHYHPRQHHYQQQHQQEPYDCSDIDNFISDERSKLMMQDKFLDEDEAYLSRNVYHPTRNKSMLEVKPPSKYDDDSCSNSTEMDLEDFNFDFEKYWEELDKPPSPIDLDMQERNMSKNLKVKNVNVGCYNNGTPINDHDREQERLLIKKSLLEGMPSPPQINENSNCAGASGGIIDSTATNPSSNIIAGCDDVDGAVACNGGPIINNNDFHYFDQSVFPFHRYSHKVYPEAPPIYKYNNFYPHDNLHVNANNSGSNALSLINNIFSIYKPNKYSPLNCQQLNDHRKPEPCKKMNVPSTVRPLGAPHSEFMTSLKRPLIVGAEQPHFKIIPEKTGLKISPLYRYDYNSPLNGGCSLSGNYINGSNGNVSGWCGSNLGTDKRKLKLKSTNRPLLFPH